MNTVPTLLPTLCDLNWDDLPTAQAASSVAFEALTGNGWRMMTDFLRRVPDNPELTGMCETYDILDKIVLYDDADNGYRIRLHYFRPGYFDRPHNHRWSFAAKILAGAYKHVLYGNDADFETADLESLQPLQVRTERPGDWYVLHHTAVHSVAAAAGTISLVLRGPAVKDRFRIIDAVSRGSFHVRGAKDETSAERAAKRMPAARLAATIDSILAASPH